MSTIPEVLAATRCGLRVLALSTITNVACPDAMTVTAAQDVVDIAAMTEPKLRRIVQGVLQRCFCDGEILADPNQARFVPQGLSTVAHR
jgi:purine nucleoside phosphorylase